MLAEAAYEGESLNPKWGVSTAADVRWEAWTSLLNGALGGYGYGAHGLSNFCTKPPACGPSKHDDSPLDWRQAAALPGGASLRSPHHPRTALRSDRFPRDRDAIRRR
jgi:hypothetical protein